MLGRGLPPCPARWTVDTQCDRAKLFALRVRPVMREDVCLPLDGREGVWVVWPVVVVGGSSEVVSWRS
jgi:hypothetical protein